MTKHAFPRTQLLAAAAAAALAAAAPAAGARAADSAPADEEDAAPRDTITVYATSNPLPVFTYPGQVSVVTREDVLTFAPSAVSDLLRDVPGVEMGGGPRRTGETPSLRGFGRDNVLVLLDGARQSFSSGHDGAFFLDPSLVKTAEAVRGPASALYGSGAVGGVLAFETIDAADVLGPEEDWGGSARLGYQSVNEETFASLTAVTRRGALDAVAGVALRGSSDIRLGSGADLPSDDDIYTVLLKGRLSLLDGVDAEASWQRFRNDAVEPDNGQGVSVADDSEVFNEVAKAITSDTWRLGFDVAPRSVSWLDADVTLYRTETEVEDDDPVTERTTLREIETMGLRVAERFDFQLGAAANTVTIGGDVYRDEQTGRDDAAPGGVRAGAPDAESEFVGAFLQLESTLPRPLGLPGELVVIPGVRVDRFESEAESFAGRNEDEAVSPRLGASYAPAPWLLGFVSWGEAFRAPSVNELYLDGVHFSFPHPILGPPGGFISNRFIANPNLEPETSETLEAGFGLTFDDLAAPGDELRVKASYYESEVDGFINLFVDFAFDPTCFAPPFAPCSAGTTSSANIATAELAGVEAEAVYESGRVRLRASYSDVDGEITALEASTAPGIEFALGDKVGALTPARLNLDARLKLPARGLALGARLQLADDFDKTDDPEAERAGYAVVDLYATWRPAFAPRARLDLGVDNVFDRDYDRVFAGVSEPGRNAKIALTYELGGADG